MCPDFCKSSPRPFILRGPDAGAIGLGWPERGFRDMGGECFGALGEGGDGQMPVLGWY